MHFKTADKCGWTKLSGEMLKIFGSFCLDNEEQFGWYCHQEQKILNGSVYVNWKTFGSDKGYAKSNKCTCLKKDADIKRIFVRVSDNLKYIPLHNIILNKDFTSSGKLYAYYKEERFVDYKIQVADKVFKVHKIFFSSISPLFERLFMSQFKESADLYVLEEDPDRFGLFVKYLYKGKDFVELDHKIQLGMIEIALRLEINLYTVEQWVYSWSCSFFNNGEFDQMVWEKYREIILSLSNLNAPYILAEKIFNKTFPPGYNWDTNLSDQYNEIKANVNKYLVWRRERDIHKKRYNWHENWDPISKTWTYS